MSRRLLSLLVSTALVPISAMAQQQPVTPTGGTVVAGEVTIGSPNGGRLVITQATQKAAINWESFSIGSGVHVDIAQPNTQSVLLNRVSGTAPSTIAGKLTANGRVYLINPNGILITKTGTIRAAGLVASTLNITPDALFATDRQIIASAASGSIVNDGQIRIAPGGYAALIGGQVRNTGLIAAPMGHISLAGGTTATIDFSGDGFLQVAVPEEGIESAGALNDGMVAFRPGAAMAAARRVVNLSTIRQAVSVAGSDGNVYLSGTVDVASASGHGGSITITGREITLSRASLDASGTLGGGRIRIGGDWQGQGDLPRADTLTVDTASAIRADAGQAGDGGTIVLWSDNVTDFRGTISARSLAGTGGDAEVSGKVLLNYEGSADLRGQTYGTLLLDPYNVRISDAANSNVSGFTPTGNDSIINVTTLVNALATANVSITTGTSGSQAGNIGLATSISWQSPSTLTLTAANNIVLGGDITAPNGNLNLSAINIAPNGAIVVNRFNLQNGFFLQGRPSGLPNFFARDFRISGNLATTSFIRNRGGDGNTPGFGTPFSIEDIYGLQGLRNLNLRTFASAFLTKDIDASVTTTWNNGEGFLPLGGNGASAFQNFVDGQGHVISNLYINRPNTDNQSLFGVFGNGELPGSRFISGIVQNLSLVNANIIGRDNVGGIASTSRTGTIFQVYVDGKIAGITNVGGVLGRNLASTVATVPQVISAYSTAEVTGNASIGGLVGRLDGGTIITSYASGAVRPTGTNPQALGGLVGSRTAGTITNSYWDTETTGRTTSAGGGTGLTAAQARQASSYFGFDFVNQWYQGDGSGIISGLRPIGRWQAARPDPVTGVRLVENLHQLQLINILPSASYRIVNDIDATATAAANPAGIWGSGGFFPIFGAVTFGAVTGFNGLLDGGGNLIRNLFVNRPTAASAGLVANLSGTITNIGVVGGSIRGGNATGGLVGQIQASGVVSRSYSSNQVTGGSFVGGLVGFNQGLLQDVYATGATSGTFGVGGLVGANTGSNSSIVRAYATGLVTGTNSTGGLVGSVGSASSISSSYWDIQTTGIATSAGGGTGLTTAQAQDLNAFRTTWLGFDFTNIWAPPNQIGQNNLSISAYYPELFRVSRVVAILTDGTSVYGGAAAPINVQFLGLRQADGIYQSADSIISPGVFSASVTPTSNAGLYQITGSNVRANDSRYRYVYVPSSYVVTPRGLTVTADPQSRIYGNANPSLTYQVGGLGAGTGLVNGDTLTGLLATAAITTSNVGSYAITQGSLSAGSNYALTYVGSQLAINPRGLTITADPLSRIYGDANPLSGSATGVGLVNGDRVDTVTLSSAADAASSVGRYDLLASNALGTGLGNYTISYATAIGGLTVAPRSLTITADPLSRIYGDANPALTFQVGGLGAGTGLVNGDTLTGLLATTAITSSNVGSYAITQGTLTASSNYALTYTGAQLAVTPRGLTITADPLSRIYGEANPALTYRVGAAGAGTGLVNGDTLNGLLATTAITTSNVGSYAITQGSLSAGSNYALTYVGSQLAINPRGLTITADPLSRIYGDANPPSGSATGVGLINGDTVSSVTLSSPADAVSGVGHYDLMASNAVGTGLGNYTISYANNVDGLTVTPRSLIITADPLSRIYGEANPELTYKVGGGGLVSGDTLAGLLATSATTSSNVGSYAITQGSLTAGSNYTLSYIGALLSVTPRGLTITADPLSRVYGDANPSLTYQVGGLGAGTGLVNGDTLTGLLATAATTTSNVGSYAITQGTLTASSNYAFNYTGAQLAVTPRGLTITADTLSRIYGDANPALTYQVGGLGLVNGDTLTGLLATAAITTSNVGSYAITQGSLSAGGNYALNYAGAQLSVTPRALAVTADPLSRVYGDANPALTYRVGGLGLVNGDSLNGLLATTATIASNVGSYDITQGTLDAGSNYALSYSGALLSVTPRALTIVADPLSRIYGDANPLSGSATGVGLINGDTVSSVTLSSPATVTSSVGRYDLLASNALGTGLGNYTIRYAANVGGLTVTPRALTITADPLSRIYGDANPALTYKVGGAGLVNSDTLDGLLATSATTASNVGSYDVTQGSLSAGSNYALTYVGAQLAITPRRLIITADPLSKIFGDPNPPLTYQVGGAGLANGDTLTGMLATMATIASNVGSYDITQGSLSAGSNYALTYVPATLTILPGKPLPPAPFSSLFLKRWIEAAIIAEPGKLEHVKADRYRPVMILQTPAFFPLHVCRKDIPCPDDHLAARLYQANPPEAGLALRNKADEHSAVH